MTVKLLLIVCVPRFAAASDEVYQVFAHGRRFSQGTPASSTTKTPLFNLYQWSVYFTTNRGAY